MSILGRLLRCFGVVRLSHHAAVLEQLRRAESQVARLQRELEQIRAASRVWKEKSDAASRGLKEAHGSGRRAERQIERLTRQCQKATEENARLRASVLPLVERVTAAERDLVIARDNLMAVEVKLDILEGAAQVLDRRTRIEVPRESGTSASA